MKRWLFVLLLLAGCASDGRQLQPGADAAAVRAEMGEPGEIVKLPEGGEAWFYPRGRVGRQTFRAELGPDGKLRGGVEQVLTEAHFDRIIAKQTTADEVRRMIGPPNYVYTVLNGDPMWEYHYNFGAQTPFVLRLGIGKDGVVNGQSRVRQDPA